MSIVLGRHATSCDEAGAFWLEELKAAHVTFLSAIDELERLTRGPKPRKDLLVTTRWRVSKASLARRLLWGRIHAFLSGRLSSKCEEELRRLQESDMRLLRCSTAHVGTWTADAVMGDWSGYCRASEVMRSKMINSIMTEKRLLYPILEAVDVRS